MQSEDYQILHKEMSGRARYLVGLRSLQQLGADSVILQYFVCHLIILLIFDAIFK